MNRFEHTLIWQKTLGKQLEPDLFERERELLRVEFEKFRDRAKILAAEIATTLPEFTVHDINHIDALWETAEIVTSGNLELTPTEAFVLGGSFLIHDLGMGLAAFPQGMDQIKKEAIWQDTITSLLREKLNSETGNNEIKNADETTKRIATEKVLRLLHAKHAEKLALISWQDKTKRPVFLIENTDLRESYGSIIGLIAHSHWWKVDELENKLPKTLGAPGIFPQNWTIDPIKLACILRIADAIQIDDRRAPYFLRTIRKPSSLSDAHWNFQQKLYQPRLERNRLVFTSKSNFPIAEVESWWVCHDTLKMIDEELKEVDSLLIDTNRQRLNANGVASIEDPKRLSKLITVEGWQPIDTTIKVSNVAKLVTNLGGEQLYGRNLVVPLRELIQNASDAIRARRLLENENSEFGDITIKRGKDEQGEYIEVEDNGIGMSKRVLTGPFLDFGQSFWGSSLMHEELPGLESKGFASTGKYGIGFFSVFMWGEKISIYSKRFESGRDNTLILEFNKGVNSRPILRKAEMDEVIKDGGTRIRVWLKNDQVIGALLSQSDIKKSKRSMAELIERLCPSLDCNVYLDEKSTRKLIIKANDWISIDPLKLIKRIAGSSSFKDLSKSEKVLLEKVSKNMKVIKEGQNIVGRILIFQEPIKGRSPMSIQGVVTVGGFRTSGLSGLLGVLIGKSDRASRDVGIPIVSNNKLKEWATDQANMLGNLNLDPMTEIECASIVRSCRGNTMKLKIGHHKSGMINYQELKQIIDKSDFENYLVVQDAAITTYELGNNCKINFYENVFWIGVGVPSLLQTKSFEHYIDWPDEEGERFSARSLEGITTEVFSEVWKENVDKILNNSKISSDEIQFEASVGKVKEEEVVMHHVDIIKNMRKK